MKRIIIPTDFSPAADNAMHYGAQLAQAIGADVLLLHVYMIPITINEMPVMVLSGDELKKGADAGLERCREEIKRSYPTLEISVENRLGDVVEELKDICKETDPFAVVMSTHNYGAAEQLLFGSNVIAAIRKINSPVINIPADYKYQLLKNIVLATDLQQVDKTPAPKIMEMVQFFGASLHLVHVATNKDEGDNEAAIQLTNLLQPAHTDYTIIKNENFFEGLSSFAQKVLADLIIVIPHEHSWMETFFFKLHTKDVVTKATIPVLTIPEVIKTQHS